MKYKFGNLKSHFFNKLTESYEKGDKQKLKELLNELKNNMKFKKMYLLYEDIENKYIEDKEIAKIYVEQIGKLVKNELGDYNSFCKGLKTKLGKVKIQENSLYDVIDLVLEEDNLNNIDKKLFAKKKLYEHLITKKEISESEPATVVNNESLLHAILTNNFNVVYNNSLSESQKKELKSILSLSEEDVIRNISEMKEKLASKLNNMIVESTDQEFVNKIKTVLEEVNTMHASKYNYYRLQLLKDGLD